VQVGPQRVLELGENVEAIGTVGAGDAVAGDRHPIPRRTKAAEAAVGHQFVLVQVVRSSGRCGCGGPHVWRR
jgi:hypothetical protein